MKENNNDNIDKKNNDENEKTNAEDININDIMEKDVLTTDETLRLQEYFKEILCNNKTSLFFRFKRAFCTYSMKIFTFFVTYILCFDILYSTISYKKWYYVLIYTGGLSILSVVVQAILKRFRKLLFNPILYFCFKSLIMLLLMVLFNMNFDFFVFNKVINLIIFYILSVGLSLVFNYFILKYRFSRRR